MQSPFCWYALKLVHFFFLEIQNYEVYREHRVNAAHMISHFSFLGIEIRIILTDFICFLIHLCDVLAVCGYPCSPNKIMYNFWHIVIPILTTMILVLECLYIISVYRKFVEFKACNVIKSFVRPLCYGHLQTESLQGLGGHGIGFHMIHDILESYNATFGVGMFHFFFSLYYHLCRVIHVIYYYNQPKN